jgi:hypothetical protein
MERETESILMLMEHPLAQEILGPVFDPKKENLHFERISYGVLSGGEKALVSWAWALWMGCQPPSAKQESDWKEWPGYSMRDAFHGLSVLDDDLTAVVVRAFLHRYQVDASMLGGGAYAG